MPFIPVPNVCRVVITYRDTAGNESVNVLHFGSDEAAVTPSTMNVLLGYIETWLNAYWDTVACNQVTASRLEALDLTTANSFYVSRTINVVGVIVDNMLPPQDTIAVSLRSAFSGRSRRGRLYHVGTPETAQDGGYLNETFVGSVIAVYEELMFDLGTQGWEWLVVSYVSNGAPRAQGQTTAITDIVVTDLVVDSMDKRKPRL